MRFTQYSFLPRISLLLILLIGCRPPASSPEKSATSAGHTVQSKLDPLPPGPARAIRFTEVTRSGGIDWRCRTGEEAGLFVILESLGSGCGIVDYDHDGRLDICFAGGGAISPHKEISPLPIAVFRQEVDWRFGQVTLKAGLESIRHYHHGVYFSDMDEDGFDDLLITGWGGLQLFNNRGDGTFADVTDGSGLDDSLWSSAAAWADLNQDQVLDLYVGHYVNWSWENDPACKDNSGRERIVCAPSAFDGLPCTVYLGIGDGTFREASDELGIRAKGKTLGVVIADVNGDHKSDIYVGNDTVPNHLYQLQASGKYEERAMQTGVALGETGSSDGSMGVDVGDFDGDGRMDIWVANFENETFALYRNLGNDVFLHSSRVFGITAVGSSAVGFGTVVFDVDGDGWSDIFCSNGHVLAPHSNLERRQRPYLFWNDHGKRFRNIAADAGEYMSAIHHGRGAASGDLDGNGTIDLVVTHVNEPVAVLRNDTQIPNWIAVRLIGRVSTRSAIGAEVTVTIAGRKRMDLIKGGGSYLSTSDATLHFGLGDAKQVDTLEVRWPSGAVTRHTDIPSGSKRLIVEPADAEPIPQAKAQLND